MIRLGMAALAKQGRTFCQHARMIRAVWFVAQAAVFADRFVLPEKRATRFCVALLAGVIDVQARELRSRSVAVHVMAAGAVHLSFEEWMRKCLARFTALRLVALVADFRLGRDMLDRVPGGMTDMTVGAANLVTRVRPVVPANTHAVLVAFQAHAVCSGYIAARRRVEIRHRRSFLSASDTPGMRITRTVAGLALQLAMTERSVFVRRDRVSRLENRKRHRVFVTRQAGIGTFAAVVAILTVGGGCRQGQ